MGVRGFESDIVENWAGGIAASTLADRLANDTIPYGRNTQMWYMGQQQAIMGTRAGCTQINTESDGQSIYSSFFGRMPNGSDYVYITVNANGDIRLFDYDATGTFTTLASAAFDGESFVSWQFAKSAAYGADGTNQKYVTTSVAYDMGLAQPDIADVSHAISPSDSLPVDTYDFVIQWYDSVSGVAGPISNVKTINQSFPSNCILLAVDETTAPARADKFRVYIRQQSTTSEFFLFETVDITNDPGKIVTVAASQSELDNLVIIAPLENDNYPPPADTSLLLWHKSRMYAATGNRVYWSESNAPENFNLLDRYLDINPDDGESITGMVSVGDVVAVFKPNATYYIEGDTEATFTVRKYDIDTGCIAPGTIVSQDNRVYWMSQKGPVAWSGPGASIVDITTAFVKPLFDETAVDYAYKTNFVAFRHELQNYVAWAVTQVGDSMNKLVMPFHSSYGRWMASAWETVDIASVAYAPDASDRYWPMVTDYNGNVYKFGSGYTDGVPAAITTPSGSPTSATLTTLTDSSATWGSSTLIGRYVWVYYDGQRPKDAERRKIVANTGTTLTVEHDFSVVPDTEATYVIGGILFDMRSGFRDGGSPFHRKRIEFVFLQLAAESNGLELDIDVYKDMDTLNPVRSHTIEFGIGQLFDQALFDVALFAATGAQYKRLPIRTTGYTWQLRFTHLSVGQRLYLYRHGVQWQTKTRKANNGANG